MTTCAAIVGCTGFAAESELEFQGADPAWVCVCVCVTSLAAQPQPHPAEWIRPGHPAHNPQGQLLKCLNWMGKRKGPHASEGPLLFPRTTEGAWADELREVNTCAIHKQVAAFNCALQRWQRACWHRSHKASCSSCSFTISTSLSMMLVPLRRTPLCDNRLDCGRQAA
eukprot:358413-Chlamydomonas_euryale.AAC.13